MLNSIDIACFVCFLNIVINRLTKKKLCEPIMIFSLIWFFMMFFYQLGHTKYVPISDKTRLCLLLTVTLFTLGNFFSSHIHITKMTYSTYLDDCFPSLRLMQAVAIIIMSYGATIDIYCILTGGSMSYYRYLILPKIRTALYLTALQYIAFPIVWITIPLTVCKICYQNISRKDATFSLITIIIHILCTGGGRFPFLYMLVSIFIILSLNFRNLFYISSIKKRRLFIFSFLMIVAVIYISVIRGATWYIELYSYFTASIPQLENHRKIVDQDSRYTYGLLSFQGFIRPIEVILRNLGSELIKSVDKAYYYIDQRMLVTQAGGSVNSTVTCSTYFYYDGGMLGVAILSFFFGAIAKYLYKNCCKKQSIFNIVEYMIIAFYVTISFININSAHTDWGFTFIWCSILKKFSIVILHRKNRATRSIPQTLPHI